MTYPKHTPIALAAAAAIAGGYGSLRKQPAPLEPPHMIAVGPREHAERAESRADCEKACKHLRDDVGCSLGTQVYCVPSLQTGDTPISPNVIASCKAIAQAIDLDDARRMGVRCE